MTTAYQKLEQRFARLSALQGAGAVLSWDQSAMMPDGGATARASQMAEINVVCHELLTDVKVGAWLDDAKSQSLDSWQDANLREMRRQYRNARALPADLVAARTKANAACEMIWRQARADNNFSALRPSLETVLALTREAAAAKAAEYHCDPYDALLDDYEPGGRAEEIDKIFADLAAFLPGTVDAALARQGERPSVKRPSGPFPIERQRALSLILMQALQFDFNHGRLDVSLHPFTGGVPDDVRITTRYAEHDFTRALMGVLHETGHALYELGLPAHWRSQPVGQARGMVLHESQSLLIEMQVCRSDAFLTYALPHLKKAFGDDGPTWSQDNIAGLYRQVARSLIRVDADEVTYPLHVILRYQLERALLSGDLKVGDLPGAWNDGMARYLGIRPPTDSDGCMQDIHWPGGAFGYFPTYTLGALAAAQLFAAAKAADPTIETEIAKGNFLPLLRWLRRNVHERGSFDSTNALLQAATGAPLSTNAFKSHLAQRYLS